MTTDIDRTNIGQWVIEMHKLHRDRGHYIIGDNKEMTTDRAELQYGVVMHFIVIVEYWLIALADPGLSDWPPLGSANG